RAVLPVVGVAELDAGDLGDGVRLVRVFERARQQVLLADRLRTVSRVDAGRAQEQHALHAGLHRAVHEIGLDGQVLVQELASIGVVGVDAADLGGGGEDVGAPFGRQEGGHGGGVQQVE